MTQAHGAAAREYILVGEQPPALKDVDWRSAPTPFKTYRGSPTVEPTGCVGPLLRDTYGVTRQRWTAPDAFTRILGLGGTELAARFRTSLLRPVPSGGALYPSELYVAITAGQPLPVGLYHYDPAHDRLDVLSRTSPRHAVAAALDVLAADVDPIVFALTCVFRRNAFKYGDFGYRLGCLDTGVLIAQAIEVARRHDLHARVHYVFGDDAIEEMLGLDYTEEGVHSVIGLRDAAISSSTDGATPAAGLAGPVVRDSGVSGAAAVAGRVPSPSRRLRDASRITGRAATPTPPPGVRALLPPAIRSLRLPGGVIDLTEGIGGRRSALGNFAPDPLPWRFLSWLVRAAVGGYSSDLGDGGTPMRHTALFAVVAGVDGLERGVYYCDAEAGTLEQVVATDIRFDLQATLALNIFNLAGCGACFVPVGHYDGGVDTYGDRWYRIQNMEAGMISQRLHLAAAALRLGCRVNCGYRTDRMNELLGIGGSPLSALAQVLVGTAGDPPHCFDTTLVDAGGPRPR